MFSTGKGVVDFASKKHLRRESWQKMKLNITKAKANLFQLPLERVINQ